MLRFTRNRLWLTIFLAGLAVTAVGLLFLRPRFALLPVILIFPPIIFGGRRDGDGSTREVSKDQPGDTCMGGSEEACRRP